MRGKGSDLCSAQRLGRGRPRSSAEGLGSSALLGLGAQSCGTSKLGLGGF